MVAVTSDAHRDRWAHKLEVPVEADCLLWVSSEIGGLAGILEEAALELGVERCSGVRVQVRAEGRGSNFGGALEVRKVDSESGVTMY